jgi:hypothetical protein
MIKEKVIKSNLNNTTVSRNVISAFSTVKKTNTLKVLSSSKANSYKTECIEALQNGKVYKTTKEMLADVSNW